MKQIGKGFLVLFVVLVGLIGWQWWQQAQSDVLPGVVEREIVPHYSIVAGQIVQQPVQLGQPVKAGDVLAVLDCRDQQYTVAQLEQAVVQKQAMLDQLLTGADAEAIQQARNEVQIAQAAHDNAKLAYDNAAQDLQKIAALHELGGVSQQEYDRCVQAAETAQNNLTAAASRINTAQQQVTLLSKNADKNAVRAAQASLAQVQSQLQQSKEKLADYTITANCDGVVMSLNYTKGAMVAVGSDLVDIADVGQAYVLAYVPTEKLNHLAYGQTVVVTAGEAHYEGALQYIDVQAQYTPEEFRTISQQDQKQLKIKVRLPEDNVLKPAQTVQVELTQLK